MGRLAVADLQYLKGVSLGKLNREKEAMEAYEEVVQRFGEDDALNVCDAVPNAKIAMNAIHFV